MKITKQIIDGFVSYIDLKDIKEFIKKYPESVKENEEKKQNTSNPKL